MSEQMVCRVCRQPLSTVADTPTGPHQWVHSRTSDHPADPTPRRETLTINPACDFCSSTHPLDEGVVFEADSFHFTTPAPPANFPIRNEMTEAVTGGEDVTWQDDGLGWGACPRCAPLIRNEQWTHLQERCVLLYTQRNPHIPEPLARELITSAHAAFRATYTGVEHPAQLIEPPNNHP